jgi:hypothetical protein
VAVCFLLHFLAGCPGWVLPTVLPCGARTFLGAFRSRGSLGDATVLPTHSRVQSMPSDGGPDQIPDSSVRTRIASESGQMSTSSGAAERIFAMSLSVRRTPLADETPPRRWEAPNP